MLTYMTSAEFFASLEPLKATDEWIQKKRLSEAGADVERAAE